MVTVEGVSRIYIVSIDKQLLRASRYRKLEEIYFAYIISGSQSFPCLRPVPPHQIMPLLCPFTNLRVVKVMNNSEIRNDWKGDDPG